MLTAGVTILVLAAVPVVAVERATGCPEVSALVEDLKLQLDSSSGAAAVAGSEGDYRLHVDDTADGGLRVELVDVGGRVWLARDVAEAGVNCGARSLAIAVVVERWLATLPLPSPVAVPAAVVAAVRRRWLEVYAAPVFTVGFGPFDGYAGLAIGVGARPVAPVRLTFDATLNLPHGSQTDAVDATALRGTAALRLAGVLGVGRIDLEAGPSMRFDLTSVSIGTDRAARVTSSLGLGVGASLRLGARTRVGALVEPWVALYGHRFILAGSEQVIHVTPHSGVQVELIVGYDLF